MNTAGKTAGSSQCRECEGATYCAVWIDRPEALAALRDEWQQLADSTGADFYLMPDWFKTWWSHFGLRRQLACLVVRQRGVLVGLLPFSLETVWVGPMPIRVARIAGTDPHCIVFSLPVLPEIRGEVIKMAIDGLFGALRCDVVSFTPLSDRADFLAAIRQIPANEPSLRIVDVSAGTHVIFDLPDTSEAYLSTRLSKKRRSQYRRDLAGLDRDFAMTTHVTVPDTDEFARFVNFHNLQWRAAGMGGHFSDWPGSTAFYTDVALRSGTGRGAALYSQTGTIGPLATQFALIGGQTCHWRLPARTLDVNADKLSIGKVGLLLMIDQLIGAGIRRIEAGRGDYDYKLAYGGESVPVHRIVVGRASASGRLRLALLLGWSNLLNLLYYRIWFQRLAPRLRRLTGAKPRPLWRAWIRSRV